MSRESVRRALRTFVITTVGLFIPGLLGWLNELTEWARAEGERPFPDGHGLVYLAVSALVAGVVALVNLLWNAVEDATGKGMLRTVPPIRRRSEAGAGEARLALLIVAAIVAAWLLIALVRAVA